MVSSRMFCTSDAGMELVTRNVWNKLLENCSKSVFARPAPTALNKVRSRQGEGYSNAKPHPNQVFSVTILL